MSNAMTLTYHPEFESFFKKKELRNTQQIVALKRGIWLYFFLLLFEGALRKWVFPSLATPLLIVRDPVAIWLIIRSIQYKILKPNFYIIAVSSITVICIFTTILFGHGNIAVALFGARILLVHFPFIFVIGSVFTRDDVIALGKVTLWIAIPMAVLTAIQFYSPQAAFVNRGVGEVDSGAGFSGSLGYFRPPGTFSFTNGNTMFFSFVAPFVLFFWVSGIKFNKIILSLATLALLSAIPLSLSRGLLFSVLISLFFTMIAASSKPKFLTQISLAVFAVLVLILFLSQASFFQEAVKAFTNRFEVANNTEGGLEGVLVDRYLGGMVRALDPATEIPYLGYGLGIGTNVGAVLQSGKRVFLISEGEWGRLIGEMGVLFGIIIILIRVVFCVEISIKSFKEIKANNLLPWILLSFGLLNIPQGQWGQATALGFSAMIGGLLIASLPNNSAI